MTKPAYNELGLTLPQYEALVWTRELLASGKVRHDGDPSCGSRGNLCNMTIQCDLMHTERGLEYTCGTAACIGGWMALHMLGIQPNGKGEYLLNRDQKWDTMRTMDDMGRDNKLLAALFYPPDDYKYDNITTEEAIDAIDVFLNGGHPWPEKDTDDNDYLT